MSAGNCWKGVGQVHRSCYQLETQRLKWHQARAFCTGAGGHLVAMETAEEYHFVVQILQSSAASGTVWWTAANDIGEESRWEWADVDPNFHFGHWLPGEPSNDGGQEDCGELRGAYQFQLNDSRCSRLSEFICEYEISK
ncbi:hypothetical protein CAPTEDRAFT_198335 [Capitella teleta]|uniref:C-type lectin domain-containing protein n=1 Tax=Capitella teleta TaxID=283909 RepID=R7U9V7_CAPTE|nr:hypothetical protein CAPTEDRAFT_198335 [Capitella teleta]|eukprot:ELU03145.1 hypothetical protein CAPTEDRAFT_198335 [Capitella teleta]